MTYDAMRQKMKKGVTGTGKNDPVGWSGGKRGTGAPKPRTDGTSVSFRAGPNDPPVVHPAGMPKSE